MDIMPATRGHLLVIPRAHYQDVLSVDPEDLAAAATMAKAMAQRVKEQAGRRRGQPPELVRLAAWQTVFHFHIHVIPRYVDDPLALPWTPRDGDMDEIQRTGALLAG